MTGTFVISKGRDQKFYFVLKAGNNEVILQSMGHPDKAACSTAIGWVQDSARSPSNFEASPTKNGEFAFVLRASNKQVVGRSETYKTEASCKQGIESVVRHAKDAKIVEQAPKPV